MTICAWRVTPDEQQTPLDALAALDVATLALDFEDFQGRCRPEWHPHLPHLPGAPHSNS